MCNRKRISFLHWKGLVCYCFPIQGPSLPTIVKEQPRKKVDFSWDISGRNITSKDKLSYYTKVIDRFWTSHPVIQMGQVSKFCNILPRNSLWIFQGYKNYPHPIPWISWGVISHPVSHESTYAPKQDKSRGSRK